MKRIVTSIAIAVALVTPIAAPAQAAATSSSRAVITRVIDGDTVDTTKGRIRLIGIDSPEMDTCEGRAAKAKAQSYLPVGATVTLTKVKKVGNTDRYGRYLRYIKYRGNDFGSRMIKAGRADARYDSRDGYKRHPFQTKYVSLDKKYKDKSCSTTSPVSGEPWNQPGPDLDCADIPNSIKPVRITGPDYHGLDRDGDGWACDV